MSHTRLLFSCVPLLLTLVFTMPSQASNSRSSNDLIAHFSSNGNLRLLKSTENCPITKDITPTSSALVVNDLALLEEPFELTRTLSTIITSTSAPDTTTSELLATMIDSFGESTQKKGKVFLDKDVRIEKDLFAPLLAQQLKPVGLFNRFDLADKDGAHCGEYRIVYARRFGSPFNIIFEAVYPNPSPEIGLAGCTNVANFWASLPSLSNDEQIEKLEDFYFNGIVHNDEKLTPVITAANFANFTGQVRTNTFVDNPWQLREFKVKVDSENKAVFNPVSVKDSPLAELYDKELTADEPLTLRRKGNRFRARFIDTFTPNLFAPEASNIDDEFELINSISLNNQNKFNDVQSSANNSDNPTSKASQDFKNRIVKQTGFDADLVLDRAGTQTCGGCHKFSSGKVVSFGKDGVRGGGDDILWPQDAGFVHITRNGSLSQALTEFFLPMREIVLKQFVCDPLVNLEKK
ncbi:hypothetical protein CS022_22855 [Veronia nyctiphanis]|uniref:Uncharacterized protein n=2 Tax=Veronia nyctiphanis TaxID=1278244 RepID=A0A4Q0YKU2_9GAMM|nr:hypothetical protein CS022_22855 [Veronia nyctiphanis]